MASAASGAHHLWATRDFPPRFLSALVAASFVGYTAAPWVLPVFSVIRLPTEAAAGLLLFAAFASWSFIVAALPEPDPSTTVVGAEAVPVGGGGLARRRRRRRRRRWRGGKRFLVVLVGRRR